MENNLPVPDEFRYNHETSSGRTTFVTDVVRRLYLKVDVDQFKEPMPPAYFALRQKMDLLEEHYNQQQMLRLQQQEEQPEELLPNPMSEEPTDST